jgi:hypothetical protein
MFAKKIEFKEVGLGRKNILTSKIVLQRSGCVLGYSKLDNFSTLYLEFLINARASNFNTATSTPP